MSIHRHSIMKMPRPPPPAPPQTESSTSTFPTTVNNNIKPHLDVEQWLNALDLYNEYNDVFARFSGVEELLHYSEADIKELGIKNSSHRARIVSSLLALKIKYEKSKFFFKYVVVIILCFTVSIYTLTFKQF